LNQLASFTSSSDGYVYSAVVPTSKVRLYGVTYYQGSSNTGGYLFTLTRPANGSTPWTRTNLTLFSGGSAGSYPFGQLYADRLGNIFGAAKGGGVTAGNCTGQGLKGCGVIYEFAAPRAGATAWTQSTVYSFTGGSDGQAPLGGLVSDSAGNLYGVTANGGGASACGDGCGTIFELSPPTAGKTAWTEKVLYAFQGGADGMLPNASLLLANNGSVIYGTTQGGGVNSATSQTTCDSQVGSNSASTACGTVFELTPSSGSSTGWAKTTLYNFTNLADGASPQSGLAIDPSGNLYGAAVQGGTQSTVTATNNADELVCDTEGASGCGTIFELVKPSTATTPWPIQVLYTFPYNGVAQAPWGVVRDKAGNLFGAAGFNPVTVGSCGHYCGAIFEISPPVAPATAWSYTALHNFTLSSSDNAVPQAPLAVDKAGTLYGVTSYNSTSTVFSITGSGF
jgi:hypothetical protein